MFEKPDCCVACPFFNPAPDEQSEVITKGECRARPPTVHMLVIPGMPQSGSRVMAMQGTPPQVIGQTVFPMVQADSWCGWHPERKRAMFA